jgi:Xaa-Pro aminopeptidase
MNLFEQHIYKGRREKLCKILKQGIVLFLGNSESPRNYPENAYRFRQDSTFLYFFGLTRPELAVLYDLDNNKATLFGENATEENIVWTGSQPDLGDLASQIGIDATLPLAKLPGIIKNLLDKNLQIHYLPPFRSSNKIVLSKLLQVPVEKVELNFSKELVNAVISIRSVKETCEVREIEKALDLTRELHLKVMYNAHPGLQEKELVGMVYELAESHSCDFAYPVILTVRGEILHNHMHGNTLKKGELLLGDFGVETNMGYAADITRTIPVESHFTTLQQEIYQVVLEAQQASVTSLASHVSFRDIHFISAMKIIAGLKGIGIMQGDPEEAMELGAHSLFYPHGIGHMIGLDVHDMEDLGEDRVGYAPDMTRNKQFGLKSLRLAKKLKPGYVVSVEPGIYFIPALIDLWEGQKRFDSFINYDALKHYRSFGGIRIEDDFVITDNGARLLGHPIPKTVEEIEFIRGASFNKPS